MKRNQFATLLSDKAAVAARVREIQAYVALSQGALFNPRLTEMLRELLKEVER